MLIINNTPVTVHHKKVRSGNTMQEKEGLFFGIRRDIDTWVKWDMTCDPAKQVWHLVIINGTNAS